jgi:hypothetical protein
MQNVRLFTWLMISLTWIVGLLILLPPVGVQVNYWIFAVYCLIGPAITALVITFLHWIDRDFFGSAAQAAPLGAVFLAIFALFGYLISAEREAGRPFLEHQLETCGVLADIAGKLATLPGGEERNTAVTELWILAWGRLAIYADSSFNDVFKEFADLVYNQSGLRNLHEPALCVARMCRATVQLSWTVIPGLIEANPDIDKHCINQHKLFVDLCAHVLRNHPDCTGIATIPIGSH